MPEKGGHKRSVDLHVGLAVVLGSASGSETTASVDVAGLAAFRAAFLAARHSWQCQSPADCKL